MNLRRPNQGVITQSIPAFYPDRMGAVALAWTNGLINSYTPAGLYNNATDGSALVVWAVDLSIAPTGTPPGSFNGLVDFSYAPAPISGGALAFAGIATATSNSTTTLDVPVPAAPAGTLFLAHFTWNDFLGHPMTAPAGWTLITHNAQPSYIWHETYYRWSTGAEPDHYTWTLGTASYCDGQIAAYAGVDPTNPINASDVNQGADTNLIAPALTMSVGGCMYLALYAHNNAARVLTVAPPALHSRAVQPVSLFYDLLVAGGSIGAQTATLATLDAFATASLALAPAQKGFVLSPCQPLIAGSRAPWGQGLVMAQSTAETGSLYYSAPCASSAPTTSASNWRWRHEWPFAVIPPGQALLANLSQVSKASLSMIYEVTKGY